MGQQINLFNPSLLPQKQHFSAVTMAQALAFLAVAAVTFAFYAGYQARSITRIAAQSDKQLAEQRARFAALTKDIGSQGKDAALQQEVTRVEAQVKSRRDLLATLHTGVLGNVQGFSRYLAAFARQRIEGVWLTGISVGGDENQLVLRGRALRGDLLPPYLRALNEEEVMRGRRVTELQLSAFRDPGPTVAPGQPGAGSLAGDTAARPPTRFVEFSMVAPRNPEELPKPQPAEPRPRTPS